LKKWQKKKVFLSANNMVLSIKKGALFKRAFFNLFFCNTYAMPLL
jgi:hypothetical protein